MSTENQNQQDTTHTRNNLITPEGYKRLIDEHHYLANIERPKIVEEVAYAAKQGDRSENAEYQYGKRRLREIDRRLRFLSQRINQARIIDPKTQRKDIILFGATVELETEEGKIKTYTIVGEDEIDVKAGKISWKSPIGKALLNKKAGEWITVEAPAGDISYCIKKFYYE